MKSRATLVADCIRARYAARRAVDVVTRSACWLRYFQARSALKRLPTRAEEREAVIAGLLRDADARRVDAPPSREV